MDNSMVVTRAKGGSREIEKGGKGGEMYSSRRFDFGW